MLHINRSAVVIRPAEPFLAWAATQDDAGDVSENAVESTVYLLPVYNSEAELEAALRDAAPAIFEFELDSWGAAEGRPDVQDFDQFCAWFQVAPMGEVIDTAAPDAVEHE